MVSQLPIHIAGIVSVWLEALLYGRASMKSTLRWIDQSQGMYCSLFFETMYIIYKKKLFKTVPSRVFLIGMILMFLIATTHIALNLYRLLRGYVWLADTVGPTAYFLDLGRWDNIAHDAINAIMTWIGDSLVIYRCFIIWDNSYYIIALPTILLILSIISNAIALDMFTKVPLGTIFGPNLVHWMNTIYALAFVQNVMTTGLIAYRIWHQERESARVGIQAADKRSSLMPIVRIVVESAAIYVVELLILIILYALNHNGQFVLQEAVVPTVGMVFLLMTIRIAMRSSKTLMTSEARTPTLRWNRRNPQISTTVTTEYSSTIGKSEAISMKPMPIESFHEDMKYDPD